MATYSVQDEQWHITYIMARRWNAPKESVMKWLKAREIKSGTEFIDRFRGKPDSATRAYDDFYNFVLFE